MPCNDNYDAIVIGGGPAGSMSALLLARLGWSVALVERQGPNRHKTCGHCLSARGAAVLQRHNLDELINQDCAARTERLRLHCSPTRSVRLPLGDDASAHGVVVKRSVFDQMLLDRARREGVEVFQPASLRTVDRRERDVHVDIRLDAEHCMALAAPLLIGADGLNSLVARHAGLAPGGVRGRKFGFSLDVPSAPLAVCGRREIEMYVTSMGYLGLVRHADGELHLAGLVSQTGCRGAGRTRSFIDAMVERFPSLRGLPGLLDEAHGSVVTCGPMPCRPGRVASGRVVLLGDAAGYVEPFTGEGITWALQSAEVLAEIVAETSPGAPGSWGAMHAQRYRQRWRQQVGRRQRLCRVVAAMLEHQLVSTTLTRVFCVAPPLARRVVKLATCP